MTPRSFLNLKKKASGMNMRMGLRENSKLKKQFLVQWKKKLERTSLKWLKGLKLHDHQVTGMQDVRIIMQKFRMPRKLNCPKDLPHLLLMVSLNLGQTFRDMLITVEKLLFPFQIQMDVQMVVYSLLAGIEKPLCARELKMSLEASHCQSIQI